MNQVVIVHFFGKFCLETDIGYLDEEKIHSKKAHNTSGIFSSEL